MRVQTHRLIGFLVILAGIALVAEHWITAGYPFDLTPICHGWLGIALAVMGIALVVRTPQSKVVP